MIVTVGNLALQRPVPEGRDLEVIVKSFEYALGDVPTQHLEECFKRAMKAKRDTFPLASVELTTQYEAMKPELLDAARTREAVEAARRQTESRICQRCDGAHWLRTGPSQYRQLVECPDCDKPAQYAPSGFGERQCTLSDWRDRHLALCGEGCEDQGYSLAHRTPKGFAWLETPEHGTPLAQVRAQEEATV